MRSMQSISSAASLSFSLLLWEINHSRLMGRERCFLLHRPYSPFSSNSAKLFAFVGPVCQPFSLSSPPVRFTARQGRVWPVNLWWLKCVPVVSFKQHVEHQKFMERLNIVLFISRAMGRKERETSLVCVIVLFYKLLEGSVWARDRFSHTFPVDHAENNRAYCSILQFHALLLLSHYSKNTDFYSTH